MVDTTKVYGGGIPMGGFAAEQKGAGFDTVSETEFSGVYGGPATRPGTVKEGGPTQGKTYSKIASQDFLLDSSYKTDMEAGRPGALDIDNPDTISHADHTDDSDLPKK